MTTETQEKKQVLKGGEFLVKESTAAETYTKDNITEEQRMFMDMARDFVEQKVWPNVEEIDKKNHELVISLLEEAGELGLLGAALPEEYGGMGVNFNTESLLTEQMGKTHAFGVSFAAHTGIGTLPILYYGTDEQKQKYLPDLATGKLKAAYCLTEPGSGSDALAAKTKAVLSDDGSSYTINGQKMWITNGGFADVFTVFAQVENGPDGKNGFTGFVVDAKTEGISLGAEEEKMGIKGSSTRQVFFEDVKVAADSVLGEIGKGHKIAFNVLNIGRYKLCAMVLGGAKASATVAIKYANERQQFGTAIANFGAIKHKLAEMAIRSYVCDAATYRTSGMIKDMIDNLVDGGMNPIAAKLEAAEEYSIECAILKVFGSEVLDYCVDEAVQVHGGNGFSEEFPAARAYRDSRINRIFEGTNEINRLLAVGTLLKRAMKGSIDLIGPAMAVQKELMSVPDFGGGDDEGLFAAEHKAIQNAKKAVLMVSGAAVQKFMNKLEEQQEILMNAADALIEIFAAESALLRTEKKVQAEGEEACALHIDMMKTYLSDALERINLNGKHAIVGFAEGDEMRMMLMGLKRFTKYEPFNTIAARQRIADKLIAENEYAF